MVNIKYTTEENQKTFQRFAFWSKFIAILGFISAGFMILVGLPLLLVFGLGIVYIGLGIYTVFMTKHLWSAANQAKALHNVSNEAELTKGLLSSFESLSHFYKMRGILILISIILTILGAFAAGISILAAIQNGNFDNINNINPNSSIYDNTDLQDTLKNLDSTNY
ncbi:hypothetical protein HC864_01320 [Candidatus Gracilibacteria bacterium]|nr:hypothetical protein [Thermales bacterium]NJL96445.1 hypothetical protein [Candidatus Gracilibacteria bacterium]